MPEMTAIAAFLAAAAIIALLWGRALWYLTERSNAVRRLAFVAMAYTGRPFDEVQAALLSITYYLLGLTVAAALAIVYRLHASALFSIATSHVAFSLLGAVGEISLATLVIDLVVKITRTGGPQRFSEIREIPWMKGLEQLPASAVPVAAALGGMVEELVFRGVVMGIMTSHSVAPAIAIAVAGILFVGQQLLQVRTPFQALVIGCGSAAISLVGGSLVVVTGSVLPAMVAHGSFVLFFMSAGRTQSRKDYLSRAGTIAP